MGGRFGVESEMKQGSKFSIELRLAENPDIKEFTASLNSALSSSVESFCYSSFNFSHSCAKLAVAERLGAVAVLQNPLTSSQRLAATARCTM